MTPLEAASQIYQAAVPILKLTNLGGRRWLRNDKKMLKRTGPWLQATYEVLDQNAWEEKSPCIYFVAGDDGIIRYTGISRNGAKQRWRESPAIDAETLTLRTKKELHHSQCWQHIEQEYLKNASITYEVRCITAPLLLPVLERFGPPLSGFSPLAQDHEGLVAALERWLCNNQSADLVPWNKSMTKPMSQPTTKRKGLVDVVQPSPNTQSAVRIFSQSTQVNSVVGENKNDGELCHSIKITSDGFFTELWAINKQGERVFPHLKGKRDVVDIGLEVTLTGRKEDYHLVDLEQFVSYIANGYFEEIGRVRMKPICGGQSNGFAVRKAMMSAALLHEIKDRQKQ